MIKAFFPVLLCVFSLSGCGGGGATKPPQKSDTPIMSAKSKIKLNRNLKVLFLASNTSDSRGLTEIELKEAFETVKKILEFNGIHNSYQLEFDYYTTNYSSEELRTIYTPKPPSTKNTDPEQYVLANSQWIKNPSNKKKINDADIVVLRTSFIDGGKGYWGAASATLGHWKDLGKVPGLNRDVIVMNSPVDPDDNNEYEHNKALPANFKLTGYNRVFAHEFIHSLGYGGHDEGVNPYQKEAFSEKVTSDLKYSGTVGKQLSYGDVFSVMGSADYSLMLSPAAKENLGVKLDSVSVYSSKEVVVNKGQVLKVFINREKKQWEGQLLHDYVTYLTINEPKLNAYGLSLNSDFYTDAYHSLQGNREGFLVRLVKTDISKDWTPFTVLLDAFPPLNNYIYTLQKGHSITVGGKVKVELLSVESTRRVFKVTYL